MVDICNCQHSTLVEELEESLLKKRAENDEVFKENFALREESRKDKQSLIGLERINDFNKQKIRILEDDKEILTTKNRKLEHEISQLKQKSTDLEKKLGDKTLELFDKNNEFKKAMTIWKKENTKLLEDSMDECYRLNKLIDDRESQLETGLKTIKTLELEKEDLKKRFDTKVIEIDRMKDKFTKMKQMIDEEFTTNAQSQAEIEETSSSVIEVQKQEPEVIEASDVSVPEVIGELSQNNVQNDSALPSASGEPIVQPEVVENSFQNNAENSVFSHPIATTLTCIPWPMTRYTEEEVVQIEDYIFNDFLPSQPKPFNNQYWDTLAERLEQENISFRTADGLKSSLPKKMMKGLHLNTRLRTPKHREIALMFYEKYCPFAVNALIEQYDSERAVASGEQNAQSGLGESSCSSQQIVDGDSTAPNTSGQQIIEGVNAEPSTSGQQNSQGENEMYSDSGEETEPNSPVSDTSEKQEAQAGEKRRMPSPDLLADPLNKFLVKYKIPRKSDS